MIFLGKLQMRNHSALIIDKDGAFPPSCLCVSITMAFSYC